MDEFFLPVPKPRHKRKKLRNIPKATRTLVRERDRHRCVCCGSNQHLELHHIIPKGRYDPRYYIFESVHDPRNLATVCGFCHRKIHDNPAKMQEMLEWQKVHFGKVRKEFDDIE